MTAQQAAKHILVVDDEPGVRELLRNCFEMEGFDVCEAQNGRQLKDILDKGGVDLITLDLNLGGENGFDLVREIRADYNVPIIMITGKGDTIDRVVGLELGADDYIAKPFQLREVLARARAVLRRYEGAPTSPASDSAGERYSFEGLHLNVAQRELKSEDGERRDLTTGEFDLLLAFVRRPSRVLSRDNIMELLRGHEWSPTDRSIDALIVRLRRKIERDPSAPRLIKTVRGVGYVFAGDVVKQ